MREASRGLIIMQNTLSLLTRLTPAGGRRIQSLRTIPPGRDIGNGFEVCLYKVKIVRGQGHRLAQLSLKYGWRRPIKIALAHTKENKRYSVTLIT